ncbi:hypothetical protein BZA77DRAFT_73862 [Pyronema omphalodes]|nr:hypothetical protein BZA77DRAFT_73862 [Pyronema omphalodes]
MSTDMSVGDLRSHAVEQRREKEHRVKYRGVNAGLLGKPINAYITDQKIRSSTTWTNANKYRMRELTPRRCHCQNCKNSNAKGSSKRKAAISTAVDVVCSAPGAVRKSPRPVLNNADVDDYRDYESETSSVEDYGEDGFIYSYDHASPGHEMALDFVVNQAVEKFETKELDRLVKNEYELVDESDADEEFEMIERSDVC